METFKCLIFLTLFSTGFCTGPTPVEKVIVLITDLKDKVHADGVAEAAAYQKFADECLQQTTDKSELITDTTDSIDGHSADIASKSSTRDIKTIELNELIATIEKAHKDKADDKTKCLEELAANDVKAGKITKSLAEVEEAIRHVCKSAKGNGEKVQICLDAGHPGPGSLLQVDSPDDTDNASPSALIAENAMEDAMALVANPENKAQLVQKAMFARLLLRLRC